MKVLLTGAGGQLGIELAELLPASGHEVAVLDRESLDISDARAVRRAFAEHGPELVVNAAAYTNVDGAETERALSYAVNATGAANLATAAEQTGADIVHVSTNYVFDGTLDRPYEPFDPVAPLGVYARDKLAGEELVRNLSTRWYVVRSAGVYGRGHNFVRTMLRVAAGRDTLKVKADEYISPTYARDLAEGILRVLDSGGYGVYHLTNSGSCSWYEFAEEIFALSGTDVEVVPVPGSEYPLPAERPANGVLSDLGGPSLRDWKDALRDYLLSEGRLDGDSGVHP